jgi:serine/threonine protein kinase
MSVLQMLSDIKVYKPKFHKSYIVGSGAYSTVYHTEEGYVIKRNYVDTTTDFIGSVRELDILARTKGIPYFIQLAGVTIGDTPFHRWKKHIGGSPKTTDAKTDKIWFVLEAANYDFFQLLHKRKGRMLTLSQIKRYMAQLMLSVEYLHKNGIIHRDLKLSNILWCSESDSIRLIDYGLSRFHCIDGIKTPDMCTANYRAPEIYLGYDYDYLCDVWSLGCVLYEMLSLKAFLYISSTEEGLTSIVYKLPRDCYMNRHIFYQSNRCNPNILRVLRLLDTLVDMDRMGDIEIDIKAMLIRCGYNSNKDNAVIIDLLRRMLSVTPHHRISVTDALNHPFFDEVRDIINHFRSRYYPIVNPSPFINIINNITRKTISSLVMWYYNNRRLYRWYQHRILFQTIDICDRYLQLRSDVDSICLFYTSLYLSIKLLTTSQPIPKFFSVVKNSYLKTDEFYKQCEELEWDIITRMGFVIYRHTLYDYIDRIDLHDVEVYRLLRWYLDLNSILGITHRDLLRIYYRTRP